AYFRIMRAATIRQEVVRNLAFAKIENSGTLTSPAAQDDGVYMANLLGGERAVIEGQQDQPVRHTDSCFYVAPSKPDQGGAAAYSKFNQKITLNKIFGLGFPIQAVEVTSYAVVYRFPNGS